MPPSQNERLTPLLSVLGGGIPPLLQRLLELLSGDRGCRDQLPRLEVIKQLLG
jgi:hypothetical protein